jgi:4-hydroxybenzoate polyprenyltransferase
VAHTKSSGAERAASIVLRTLHLSCVVVLGASLLGAPVALRPAAAAAFASGALLFAMELFARRMHAFDLAGLSVLFKLTAVAAMSAWPVAAAQAPWVFWVLVVVSSISSHAPKQVRHWWPWPEGIRRPAR